jgi:hypothetical protein
MSVVHRASRDAKRKRAEKNFSDLEASTECNPRREAALGQRASRAQKKCPAEPGT